MFNIQIYKNESGKDEIEEYLEELAGKAGKSKNERIKLKKIVQYFDLLGAYGLSIGEPVIKHIESDIWELRPTNDRFFYALVENETFLDITPFHQKEPQNSKKRD